MECKKANRSDAAWNRNVGIRPSKEWDGWVWFNDSFARNFRQQLPSIAISLNDRMPTLRFQAASPRFAFLIPSRAAVFISNVSFGVALLSAKLAAIFTYAYRHVCDRTHIYTHWRFAFRATAIAGCCFQRWSTDERVLCTNRKWQQACHPHNVCTWTCGLTHPPRCKYTHTHAHTHTNTYEYTHTHTHACSDTQSLTHTHATSRYNQRECTPSSEGRWQICCMFFAFRRGPQHPEPYPLEKLNAFQRYDFVSVVFPPLS